MYTVRNKPTIEARVHSKAELIAAVLAVQDAPTEITLVRSGDLLGKPAGETVYRFNYSITCPEVREAKLAKFAKNIRATPNEAFV
jgi:hypothetical protein